jgi:hypothetical protein
VIAFLRLPLESGYLIPVVPLLLIWLGMRLTHRAYLSVCVALLVAPFLVSLEADSALPPRVQHPAIALDVAGARMRIVPYGPLLVEQARIEAETDSLRRLAAAARTVPPPAILLAGGLWSKLAVTLGERGAGLVVVDSLGALEVGRIDDPLSRTWPSVDSTRRLPVYVLPGVLPPEASDSRLRGRVPRLIPPASGGPRPEALPSRSSALGSQDAVD